MTTTTTTTRHSARCQTPRCNRFTPVGEAHCWACRESYSCGCGDTHSHYQPVITQLTRDRDAARNAAVADHAAHIEAMEERERKADAVIAELRIQRDDHCKMANDYRAELVAKDRLLDQARGVIAERDREVATLTRRERNYDAVCATLATTTQERDAAREECDRAIGRLDMAAQSDDMLRVAAQQAAAQAISQRDQAVYDAERLARWLGYAIAAAIVGALAAIAGWVR